MTRITENLIRKRAEHNECIISTLEEISLHQQDIEKIEYIDKWCRDLKILYLQSNLIPKIENIGRLKKLEYLNLALNNVEIIENLEGCESLKKLDLTVNFVGELTGIERLQVNYNLQELFLTGNPCTEYEGYRDYVVATLPHLQYLDGIEIEKSERIKSVQVLHTVRDDILEQQARYHKKREKQKNEALIKEEGKKKPERKSGTDWYTDTTKTVDDECEEPEGEELNEDAVQKTEEEKEKEFWQEKTPYTPESRLAVHKHMEEKKKREEKEYPSPNPPQRKLRLQTEDGRFLNVNEAKIDFELQDDIVNSRHLLDVAVYRYLDTSLCDVDVQPTYVRVTIKGKIVLPEEVLPDSSTVKRSQTTGNLLITMPKMKAVILPQEPRVIKPCARLVQDKEKKQNQRHERLEVDPHSLKTVDIGNIIKENKRAFTGPLGPSLTRTMAQERPNSEDFVDDPEVPPLM